MWSNWTVTYVFSFRPKTVCEICGLAVLNVKAHVLRIHSEIKPVPKIFVCPTCGWTTKDTTHFKFHMMMKHNDSSHGVVKIYKCDHCNYQHFYNGIIIKHMRLVHGMRLLIERIFYVEYFVYFCNIDKLIGTVSN